MDTASQKKKKNGAKINDNACQTATTSPLHQTITSAVGFYTETTERLG